MFSTLIKKIEIKKKHSNQDKVYSAHNSTHNSTHKYTILFMTELERKILEKVDNKTYLQQSYIDDIFFIWEHGEENLRSFVETLNEIQPTIIFTAEQLQKSISFLDVTVSLTDGKIETDLHVKPTDSHQYLHSFSCNPGHCKKSIPNSKDYALTKFIVRVFFFDIHGNNLENRLSE